MGGRGASSGVSNKGSKYGTEYRTLLQSGNIKFVKYNNSKSAKTPMETMTKERIYVTVNNNNELSSITYYDNKGKRNRQIDLKHKHDGNVPHIHIGYEHNEKGTRKLSTTEQKTKIGRAHV